MPLLRNNKQLELLIYKLLHDVLALLLLFWGLLLLADSLIPGFISGYVGYVRLVSGVALIIALIFWIGRRNSLVPAAFSVRELLRKKTVIFLLLLAVALIANSLFRFRWWENIIATTATVLIFVLLFRSANEAD